MSASVLRKNQYALVLPFEMDVVRIDIEPRDTVMTNAQRLAAVGGGGTNVSAPLALLNRQNAQVDVVIIVSDNESWVDFSPYSMSTATMRQWNELKARCPLAKLVCIDLTPNTTMQAVNRKDILNIGGFSDQVFDLINRFIDGSGVDAWVKDIDAIDFQGLA
jgi:60 kDa SS-A/Ro ribonucleoprotein